MTKQKMFFPNQFPHICDTTIFNWYWYYFSWKFGKQWIRSPSFFSVLPFSYFLAGLVGLFTMNNIVLGVLVPVQDQRGLWQRNMENFMWYKNGKKCSQKIFKSPFNIVLSSKRRCLYYLWYIFPLCLCPLTDELLSAWVVVTCSVGRHRMSGPDIWPPGLRALKHLYSRDQQNSPHIFVHNLKTRMDQASINQQNILTFQTKPKIHLWSLVSKTALKQSPKQPWNSHQKWTTSFSVHDCMWILRSQDELAARGGTGGTIPGSPAWHFIVETSERRNVSFSLSISSPSCVIVCYLYRDICWLSPHGQSPGHETSGLRLYLSGFDTIRR